MRKQRPRRLGKGGAAGCRLRGADWVDWDGLRGGRAGGLGV